YLAALETGGKLPDYAAGNSLGEYNALLAARAIDFQTGLKLVKKRGELMATAQNGGMAAVMGMDEKTIRAIIEQSGCKQVGIANLNTPSQIVISGARSEIDRLGPFFENRKTVRYVILNVSGAFHSRLMDAAGKTYAQFLESFEFCTPQIPVISNVLARPYPPGDEKKLLAQQMTHPVKWVESICYLWGKGVTEFTEMGPGNVLTKMVATIQQEATPLAEATPLEKDAPVDRTLKISAASLGCREYKKDHHLKYAYATGGMAHGIASREMVVKMGKAGMIGYFGANGLSLDEIEQAIVYIQGRLDQGQSYGMNLMAGPGEEEQVALYLKHKVARVEAAAYLQMTPALVRYKLNGLHRNPDGSVLVSNKIMGKLSRPEVAMGFLSPAPPEIVNDLVKQGAVTRDQADLARNIPMADDICVAADSGGHTDMGAASALMPALMRLRNGMMEKYHYAQKIRIGAAGGIGTPEAAAAAFILGADFILTGSINQCTVEAGTSDRVKALLQEMNVQDTAYCPAGDTFEMGSKVQVLKKGVFFPARANKLYELYRHYDAWDKIDKKTRNQLETRYFKCGFEDLYARCKQGFAREEILRAENNPKQKMALVFRWYLNQGHRLALEGAEENRVDFQIYCGPALGAFNQWVKGTELENWQNRHVDEIAEKLLNDTADLLKERFHRFIKPVAP
ncbi:MAG: PfaD family polyunsaturated fatty acid/polyketide biosynthesis protein, partial [Proteobacteria bacterium]|nr:PfaD family polyunsaturated fatty acid/polyketide biosynthesis protein [Pseudomonadota bacterium]